MARYLNILAGVLWVFEFFDEIVGKILCKLYGAVWGQVIVILTIYTQVIPVVWGSGEGSLAKRAYLLTFEFHVFFTVHTGRSCQVGPWAKLATAHTAWLVSDWLLAHQSNCPQPVTWALGHQPLCYSAPWCIPSHSRHIHCHESSLLKNSRSYSTAYMMTSK